MATTLRAGEKNMNDITTQWQKPIYTKTLHESPASYDTFKLLCHNPHWTQEQLSQHTGRPLSSIQTWSSKYHYQTRLNAYLQHNHEQVEKQKITIIKNDLEAHIQRQQKDQQLLDGDQYILEILQNLIIQQTDNGTLPCKEDIQNYTTIKDSYHKANKDHSITSQNLIRNAKEGINPDRYDKENMSPAALKFLETLQHNREERR
jgi:hypothetical protein